MKLHVVRRPFENRTVGAPSGTIPRIRRLSSGSPAAVSSVRNGRWSSARVGEESTGVTEPTAQYRYALLPLFLVAATFIVLGPTFWNGTETRQGSVASAYENSDLYQYVYPAYDYTFSRMKGTPASAGYVLPGLNEPFPEWNPRQRCGIPIATDSRLGMFQPLNAVFLFLPTTQAMALHAFLCLFLMGLFFALFARAVGVGYVAALIGGIIYAYCGASAAAMSRPWMASALVWLPFTMWAVREYGHRFDFGTAMLAGLGTALLILSGAYALVLAALCLIVPYRLLMTVFPRSDEPQIPPLMRRVRGPVLMGIVAIGVSSVQWLPTLAYALHLDDPFGAIWNFNLAAEAPVSWHELLAQMLTPDASSLPRIAYMGIITLLLVPVALFHRHRRREVAFFFLVAVAGISAALSGPDNMPLGFPHLALLYPVAFSLAALAALGADRLLTPRSTFRSQPVWLPASVALIMSGAMIYAFGGEIRKFVIPFVLILFVFLIFRFRFFALVCGIAIAGLLVVDLTVASKNKFRHPRQDAPECYQRYAAALGDLREQCVGSRALFSARPLDTALTSNLGFLYPQSLIGGALLPLTEDQARWWEQLGDPGPVLTRGSGKAITHDAAKPKLLNFMAARAILASPQGPLYNGGWGSRGPRLREVPTQGDLHLFVNEDALPRAYWVPTWRVAVGVKTAIDMLTEDSFDPTRECVVDALSPGIEKLSTTAPVVADSTPRYSDATCSVEDVDPEHVTLRVNAPASGITVLADTQAPGWIATVNGVRQPILKVNGLYRGVITPEGPCVIEFTYRPLTVYAAQGIAIAVLAFSLLYGLRVFLRRSASLVSL